MKTYTETQNVEPFDWNEFLERAIKGDVSHSEHLNAIELAGSWVTCACGNQCSIIPRYQFGAPEDAHLCLLGNMFAEYINKRLWQNAKVTLKRIEGRSAELIAEINGTTTQA